MKKVLILLLIVAVHGLRAQIVLENTYANGSAVNGNLQLIKLSSSGYKYAVKTLTTITLYNLNHSVFTTITTPTVPPLACSSCPLNIYFISEELFDTNPSTIEYFWLYGLTNNVTYARVFNQAGNLLFAKDSVVLSGPGPGYTGHENFIAYSSSGVKMILYDQYTTKARVYSLPGKLACHDCSNGIISSLQTNGGTIYDGKLGNYPNPASEQTTIEYELPKGMSNGDIVFYNMNGSEIKRFKVTADFHNIIISVADLQAGSYYYQLQTSDGSNAGKKLIVIK